MSHLLSTFSRSFGRLAVLFVAVVGLAACEATFDQHGYVPAPEQLAAVQIGDDREVVSNLIGRPGASGVLRDEAWFYSAYRLRTFGVQPPEIIDREVLAVSFDSAGRVQNIEQFALRDSETVELSRRVTTTSIREVTLLDQILRNFGRINVANAFGG